MRSIGKIAAIGMLTAILVMAIIGSVTLSEENIVIKQGLWSDATDVLSGQAAEQAGRMARAPYINTEQGNMLVFFFTLAGVAAGFIIGYNWRKLLADKASGRYRTARIRLIAGILLMIACLATASVHAFFRPLMNPGLGDVVLFVFAVAGSVSGFIGGNSFGWLKAEAVERRLAA